MAYGIVQTTGWTSGSASDATTPVFPGNTTPGNILLCIVASERYDGTPSADTNPTASRSGGETFTRLGFAAPGVGGGTNLHVNILAAECTTAATTAIAATETVGPNVDMVNIIGVEVSGLAAVGSLFLAMTGAYLAYPGTGDRSGTALGTLSGSPALLLSVGFNRGGGAAIGNASANTLISAAGTAQVLSHRRLTTTDSVSGSINFSSDGVAVVAGIALLEGSSAPTITDVSDTTLQNGQTGIVITGTGFGASQGAGSVRIGTSSSNPATGAVTQTVTSWADTSITITAAQGSLITGATSYLFVTENGGTSNATGTTVSFQGAAAASVASLLMMN